MSEPEFEHEQVQAAGEEASAIGGRVQYDQPDGEPVDPAEAPLIEAGEGESEGFELAEEELEEHASHGDLHAARRVLEDAPAAEEDSGAPSGEADEEEDPDR